MTIYVYFDEGVSGFYADQAIAMLRDETCCPVEKIDAQGILNGTLNQDFVVCLVMPGGRDQQYHNKLKGAANRAIREFVEAGGKYLGFCAGAYYGCASLVFEEGSAFEVKGDRELAFYKGIAKGTVTTRPFEYCSSAESVEMVTAKAAPFLALYHGGCTFSGDDEAKVVARYGPACGEALPAIVEKDVGDGVAILSGVHLEVIDCKKSGPISQELSVQLSSSAADRKNLLYEIFDRLGIQRQNDGSKDDL